MEALVRFENVAFWYEQETDVSPRHHPEYQSRRHYRRAGAQWRGQDHPGQARHRLAQTERGMCW